jgi:hypothetical protein
MDMYSTFTCKGLSITKTMDSTALLDNTMGMCQSGNAIAKRQEKYIEARLSTFFLCLAILYESTVLDLQGNGHIILSYNSSTKGTSMFTINELHFAFEYHQYCNCTYVWIHWIHCALKVHQ